MRTKISINVSLFKSPMTYCQTSFKSSLAILNAKHGVSRARAKK